MPTLTARLGTGSSSLPFDAGTRSKRATVPPGTGSKIELLPTEDDQKQSLTIGCYLFRRDGVGWECKETTGKGASRKRIYVKHLSRARYQKMQAEANNRDELEERLICWADNERTKKRSI